MLDTTKLGSLYFDGQPQEAGCEYNDGQITFGPAVPGKELQWIKVNGLLIADRCVCTHISWKQLHAQGLVFGAPFQIDGQFYLCRCPKVGTEDGVPNEWDAALDETGEDNEIWHWGDQYFWGQETSKNSASFRAARGYPSARNWLYYTATLRGAVVGFRPALEPLGSEPCSPNSLIGKEARIYGPGWVALEGRLLGADDYDFVLAPIASAPTDCLWASKDGDNLVVDRASVIWATEA